MALSFNNLAALYAKQGRLTEAEPLLVQALAMRQQLLSNQHLYTVETQQSLVALRRMIVRSTKKAELSLLHDYDRCFSKLRRLSG